MSSGGNLLTAEGAEGAEGRLEGVKRHVILAGLSGAGKSTVGTLVASELGGAFQDLDQVIEQEQGLTVSEIFEQFGEGRFRELEHAAMLEVLAGAPQVIAAGGGWAAVPGRIESVRDRAFTVYLEAAPEIAARRLGDAEGRPMLEGGNLGERLRELLTAREPFYRLAEGRVSASRYAQTVAREIVALARRDAGW